MSRIVFGVIAFAILFGDVGKARADLIYNNAADFSATNNPNGVWSYGTLAPGAAPDASTFSLYAGHASRSGIDFVGLASSPALPPYVSHNSTNTTINVFGSVRYNPGQAGLHPGPDGTYSDFRFTAPVSGTYDLAALFTGIDFVGPTSTDVHVLLNGSSLFSGAVTAFGSGPSYTSTLSLVAGDRVDFAVGFGSNRNYIFDSTGLDATLTLHTAAVPEPGSLTLLGAAAATLTSWRLRRRLAAVSP